MFNAINDYIHLVLNFLLDKFILNVSFLCFCLENGNSFIDTGVVVLKGFFVKILGL